MTFSSESKYLLSRIFAKYTPTLEKLIGQKPILSFPTSNVPYFSITIESDTLQSWENLTIPRPVAIFYISYMPGCCGAAVSHNANVSEGYRHKGIGTLLNQMRLEFLQALGYSLAICTDVDYNSTQAKILNKNEWSNIHNFINARTGNRVNVYVRDLRNLKPFKGEQ